MSWLLWFIASFPWENTEDPSADNWMIPVAVVFASSAAGLLLFVVMSWRGWALSAFGLQAIVGLGILAFGLEASSHSDGKLLAFALVIACAGGAAVWFVRAHVPRRHAF